MPWAGFEPAFPASERAKTYALARAASGIGEPLHKKFNFVGIYDSAISVD